MSSVQVIEESLTSLSSPHTWNLGRADFTCVGVDATVRAAAIRRLHAVNNSAADRVLLVYAESGTLLGRLRASLAPRLAPFLGPFDAADAVILPTRLLHSLDDSAGLGMGLWRVVCEYAATGGAMDSSTVAAVSSPETDPPRLPLLVPERPPRTLDWLPRAISSAAAVVVHPIERQALVAGFLQIHGWLEESHVAAQAIEHRGSHRNGDYWHAIMHRREPDYGNSKYWFRHVGRHPVFVPLAREVATLLADGPPADVSAGLARVLEAGSWQPFAFVDLCEVCADQEASALGVAARRLQQCEFLLLLEQTWHDATRAGRSSAV